ncbi:MAG: hypothetical protein EBY81_03160, partial [Verrucomicrobia bacterium]|nr:hypothetical protein [Verrucomicrobiota bacterium]
MYLHSIGTAVPPRAFTQAEVFSALEKTPKYHQLTSRSRAILRKVLSNRNGIETRHFALNEMQDAFVFDVETVGDHRGDPRQNIITWIALATEGRVDVIPMGHPNGDYVRTEYPLLPSAQDRIIKGLPIRPSDYSKDER